MAKPQKFVVTLRDGTPVCAEGKMPGITNKKYYLDFIEACLDAEARTAKAIASGIAARYGFRAV